MFDAFTYYGDTGRWRVSCDDAGTVTATYLLPGNGLFARDGETVTIGSVHTAWTKPGHYYSARSAGWPYRPPAFTCDDYTSADDAASALIAFYDDARADTCEGAA